MFIDVNPIAAAQIVVLALLLSSPLWIPIAFAAYATGKGQYSLQALFIFLVIESVSLAVAIATFGLSLVAKE